MTTASYRSPRPVTASLKQPDVDTASLNDVLRDQGWGVQAVNWVFEAVTGESLVSTIITPITGDWSKIRADGDAWRMVGNAMNDVSYNLTDAVGKVRGHWDGDAARAHEKYIALGWKAGLLAEMGVAQLIAKGFDTVASGAEALGKQAARLLDYLVNKLLEAAATVWIPVAGWIKAAEMVWNAYQIYRRVMDIIDTVQKLIADVKALFDAVGRVFSAIGKLKDADSLAEAMNATQEVAEAGRDVRNAVRDISDDAASIKDSATEIADRGHDVGSKVREIYSPPGGSEDTKPAAVSSVAPGGAPVAPPPTLHASPDAPGTHAAAATGPAASAPPSLGGGGGGGVPTGGVPTGGHSSSGGVPSSGGHGPAAPPSVNTTHAAGAAPAAAPPAPHQTPMGGAMPMGAPMAPGAGGGDQTRSSGSRPGAGGVPSFPSAGAPAGPKAPTGLPTPPGHASGLPTPPATPVPGTRPGGSSLPTPPPGPGTSGSSHPGTHQTPGSHPTPGTHPTPGSGSGLPTPPNSGGHATPGSGSGLPTPPNSGGHPTPGSGSGLPTPPEHPSASSGTATAPAPSNTGGGLPSPPGHPAPSSGGGLPSPPGHASPSAGGGLPSPPGHPSPSTDHPAPSGSGGPTTPHDGGTRPHDTTPNGSTDTKPHDTPDSTKPHDADTKPHDADTRPHDGDAKPHDSDTKPHDADTKPHDGDARPDDGKPHDTDASGAEGAEPHDTRPDHDTPATHDTDTKPGNDDATPGHNDKGDGSNPPPPTGPDLKGHFDAAAMSAQGQGYQHQLEQMLPNQADRDRYVELSQKLSTDLSASEAQHVADVRNQIKVDSGDIVTKALNQGALSTYLPDQPHAAGSKQETWQNQMGGSIARGQDVVDVNTPQGLRDGLALDDKGKGWTPIPEGAQTAMQLRYEVTDQNAGAHNVPFGGPKKDTPDFTQPGPYPADQYQSPQEKAHYEASQQQMAAAGGAAKPYDGYDPFTGTGSTMGGMPEWRVDGGTPLPDRAEIWQVNADGTEKLHAVYDRKFGWTKL
ncbi:hypothetical protein SAMN04488564_119124 [Lentzea waywayandensis]|uniref:Proteins of 100 residues with WXG n=1 Tax=Lentzea waywayandensis TaxID=84724 RepID=A0A1I6FHQ8_9PSEU|nr:hypothetical protein [Lentzea waywayandensis]SFR29480.1 hypothetical protein SAMN04488564_119124 [Lentzea waywayandensis]